MKISCQQPEIVQWEDSVESRLLRRTGSRQICILFFETSLFLPSQRYIPFLSVSIKVQQPSIPARATVIRFPRKDRIPPNKKDPIPPKSRIPANPSCSEAAVFLRGRIKRGKEILWGFKGCVTHASGDSSQSYGFWKRRFVMITFSFALLNSPLPFNFPENRQTPIHLA